MGHGCAPPQSAFLGLHNEMHPRTQPQHNSLDSDLNHDTLLTYLNPTSNTVHTNSSRGSFAALLQESDPHFLLQGVSHKLRLPPSTTKDGSNSPLHSVLCFCIIHLTLRDIMSKRVFSWCGVPLPGIFVAWWPTFVVMSRYSQVIVRFDRFAPSRGPCCLPLPRTFMILEGMNAPFLPFHSRDLGVCGASIERMSLSCLDDLNSDLYRLCGSLHATV